MMSEALQREIDKSRADAKAQRLRQALEDLDGLRAEIGVYAAARLTRNALRAGGLRDERAEADVRNLEASLDRKIVNIRTALKESAVSR